MNSKVTNWRTVAHNSLIAMQGLFTATVTWDFFMTVLIEQSFRASLFAGLSVGATALIAIPWLLSIFMLVAYLVTLFHSRECEETIVPITYGYYVLVGVYVVLAWMAIISAGVTWPIVLNYLVNICWALSLVYLRKEVLICCNST